MKRIVVVPEFHCCSLRPKLIDYVAWSINEECSACFSEITPIHGNWNLLDIFRDIGKILQGAEGEQETKSWLGNWFKTFV